MGHRRLIARPVKARPQVSIASKQSTTASYALLLLTLLTQMQLKQARADCKRLAQEFSDSDFFPIAGERYRDGAQVGRGQGPPLEVSDEAAEGAVDAVGADPRPRLGRGCGEEREGDTRRAAGGAGRAGSRGVPPTGESTTVSPLSPSGHHLTSVTVVDNPQSKTI